MATATFDKEIVVSTEAAKNRLTEIIDSASPARKTTVLRFSSEDRNRGEKLLAKCLSRSKH